MKRSLVFLFCLLCIPAAALASEPRFDIPLGDSPSRGTENAPITMIEFIDFQ